MTIRALAFTAFGLLLATLFCSSAAAQTLYSQNFDVNNQAAAWSINSGPTDEYADFFFDYSSVGIPLAPNSPVGAPTRGLQLQTNLTAGVAGGVNVSPIGQSFNGDYRLLVDVWSNFIGAETADDPALDGLWEGGSGSTKATNMGILSSGTGNNYRSANWNGVAEALYFSANGDGQGSFDYNIHGPGVSNGTNTELNHGPGGFRATTEVGNTAANAYRNWDALKDAGVEFFDVYPEGHSDVGETNRGAQLDPTVDPPTEASDDGDYYQAAFPSVTAPGQAALYPFTQYDGTMDGAFGMAWREVEIKKVGTIVTWSVLNAGVTGDETVLLGRVDLSLLQVPATSGTNIMLGESDPTANIGTDSDFAVLQFSLFDNVRVETVTVAPSEDADFDADGDVDGADFLTWQRNLGAAGGLANGDADGNATVNALDLAIWKVQFSPSAAVPAAAAVPEPGALGLAMFAMGAALVSGKPRRMRSNT